MLLRNSVLALGGVAAVLALSDPSHENSNAGQEYSIHQEPLHYQTINDVPPQSIRSETIYQVLSSTEEYSKLTKAINYVDEIAAVLKDSSAHITFFATPNDALRRPHRDPYKHFHQDSVDLPNSATLMQAYDLADIIQVIDELETSSKNDEDHDKKKKFFKKLLQVILSYHILPSAADIGTLADNNTFATTLVLPDSLGARPLRIRVSQGIYPPTPIINLYSGIIRPQVYASNGILHGINHPLLPPPSLFQELYMLPSAFSTFTSAIQRTGLADTLDLRYIRGKNCDKGSFEGASTVTVFAPTNRAFESLPKRLQLFLFSPFGNRILKKLLQYHIVPGLVFHTDYQYNKTSASLASTKADDKYQFDISQIKCLTDDAECFYPIKYNNIEQEYTEEMYHSEAYHDDNIDSEVLQDSPAESPAGPAPSNPFEFNTKHYEEIINMDTEEYESLSDAHQEYVANYLELYDTLTTGGADQPVAYPSDERHHNSPRCMSGHSFGPFHMRPHVEPFHHDAPIPPPMHCGHANHPPSTRPAPISSFNLTIPTALTNRSIHVEVEKFNFTIPFPGPHKPHRVLTKLSVNKHTLFMFDLVGLNGAIHAIDRLLDPRGHYPHHPGPNSDFLDDASLWDDWEEWLPQWAAKF